MILYIEDDLFVQRFVEDALGQEGWEVEVCANSAAAMERIEIGRPNDLIITDMGLPGANGIELVRRRRGSVFKAA